MSLIRLHMPNRTKTLLSPLKLKKRQEKNREEAAPGLSPEKEEKDFVTLMEEKQTAQKKRL